VLQCVAVCCSVLQCVAVCCMQCGHEVEEGLILSCLTGNRRIASCERKTSTVCCSVLQCVAVCCSMLQCVHFVHHVKERLLLSCLSVGRSQLCESARLDSRHISRRASIVCSCTGWRRPI